MSVQMSSPAGWPPFLPRVEIGDHRAGGHRPNQIQEIALRFDDRKRTVDNHVSNISQQKPAPRTGSAL